MFKKKKNSHKFWILYVFCLVELWYLIISRFFFSYLSSSSNILQNAFWMTFYISKKEKFIQKNIHLFTTHTHPHTISHFDYLRFKIVDVNIYICRQKSLKKKKKKIIFICTYFCFFMIVAVFFCRDHPNFIVHLIDSIVLFFFLWEYLV